MTREDFILRSKRSHGDKFEYPAFDNYSSSSVKVPIICPIHGLFSQNPFDHVKGIGCRTCFFESTKTWTDKEDEFLRTYYKKNKAAWCAKKLGKTEHAIRGRASTIGIATRQRYCNNNVPAYLWRSLVSRSREKNAQLGLIDFDSDYLWELYNQQGGLCALSGWPITYSTDHSLNTVSVDRIDSNVGYSRANIQLTHKIVNRCKLNLPENLFFQLCKSVYQKNIKEANRRYLTWEDDIWNDTVRPRMAEYIFADDFVLENSKIIESAMNFRFIP